MGWLICYVSLSMLFLLGWSATLTAQWVTTVVVLAFLAPWGWIVLRQPSSVFRGTLQNWGLLTLPLMAMASFIWSDYPSASLRGGAQYMATVIVGILIGYCIKPRLFTSALLCSLVSLSLLSLVAGTGAYSSFTGGYTFVGVFGSKNYFAVCMSFLLLTANSVVFDRRQPFIFRMVGVIGAMLAVPLLFYARSVGALVVSIMTLATSLLLRMAMRLPPKPRAALLMLIFLSAIATFVLATFDLDLAGLLGSLGKDVTLSGRVLLWQEAVTSISDHPLLGVGYDAFWQVGNWGAEELWHYSYVPNKTGYNFHNTYFQVGVDLGLIGLSIFVGMLFLIAGRIVVLSVTSVLSIDQMFAASLFVFLLLRTPLEVDLFFQFQIASILIGVVWVYLQPKASKAYAS
jgi:exopolysaccharide production protein ExoQ